MKVLLVIAQLDVGGAEVQAVRLARELKARQLEPEVATFYPGRALEPELASAGVPVHVLKRSSWHGLETILDLKRVLASGKHTVVHSFLWPANWRTRIAARLAKTPVVIASPRSIETWLTPAHVILDRVLARWTDAILVNAEAIREFLVSREGIPRERFRVIHNGIDETALARGIDRGAARERIGFDGDGPMILCVGNLQPEKNHEDFVRLAAEVHQQVPGAKFVSVGRGDREPELRALAERLGASSYVEWAGFRRNVPDYLAACDVFVNVSKREGCCNAILEAMAAAKPVVAYRVGGNPELVEDGTNGRVFELGDVESMAAAVCGYLKDRDSAVRAGEAGRERVRNGFLTDHMVGRTLELYRELSDDEKRRR